MDDQMSKAVAGFHLYRVDEDGFPLLEDAVIVYADAEDNIVSEVPDDVIRAKIPQGLDRPRWTGTEWIDDKTAQEVEDEKLLQSLIPSEDEVKQAELEINIISLLQDLGVLI